MAAAFTPVADNRGSTIHSAGDHFELIGDVTFSGSYPAGGDVVDFASVLAGSGAGVVWFVIFSPRAGYTFEFVAASQKILIRQGDNTNAASAPGIEIPAAAYPGALTALPLKVLVKGL